MYNEFDINAVVSKRKQKHDKFLLKTNCLNQLAERLNDAINEFSEFRDIGLEKIEVDHNQFQIKLIVSTDIFIIGIKESKPGVQHPITLTFGSKRDIGFVSKDFKLLNADHNDQIANLSKPSIESTFKDWQIYEIGIKDPDIKMQEDSLYIV